MEVDQYFVGEKYSGDGLGQLKSSLISKKFKMTLVKITQHNEHSEGYGSAVGLKPFADSFWLES